MLLVGLGHVRGARRVPAARVAADVGSHALATLEELDGRRRQPRVEPLVHEAVRDRVVMVVDLDVVVDVDTRGLPLGVDEGLGRQRAQRRLVETFEELAAARPVAAHRAGVEVLEQLGDACVERGQRKEGLVPQAGEDPALGDLHRHFDDRLVQGRQVPAIRALRGRFGSPIRSTRGADSAFRS